VVDKFYLPVKTNRCILCNQAEVFPFEDPLVVLSIHEICLELLAANLPKKTGKILMKAVKEQK
jgi:hypothetical protein